VANRPPVQQPPPVQRLWLRYARRGVGRFASHRDFARVFERALRRAAVPMAYSSGFSPHPRVSWANPAHTGALSESEYVEVGLAVAVDPAELAAALDAALPVGFAVVGVAPAAGNLAAQLEASDWDIRAGGSDTGGPWFGRAADRFLAAGEVLVTRQAKHGPRTFDTRAAVVSLAPTADGFRVVLRHTAPLVRPDDVVAGLCTLDPSWSLGAPAVARRLGQGRLVGDRVEDPVPATPPASALP